MVFKKFEDLIAWQKAQDVAVEIYFIFDTISNFSFKNQICKAVVSISNNIAEGFVRSSDADFLDFCIYHWHQQVKFASCCILQKD